MLEVIFRQLSAGLPQELRLLFRRRRWGDVDNGVVTICRDDRIGVPAQPLGIAASLHRLNATPQLPPKHKET